MLYHVTKNTDDVLHETIKHENNININMKIQYHKLI
jgi:hypothetical protein